MKMSEDPRTLADSISKATERLTKCSGDDSSQRDVRVELLNLLQSYQRQLLDPIEYIELLHANYQRLSCLIWIVHFGVLDHIPAEDSIHYDELAQATKTPVVTLKSVARMLMTEGILAEPQPERVAHSSLSAALKSDTEFYDCTKFVVKYTVTPALCAAQATEKWGEPVKKDQTAFNLAMKTDLPFFGYLANTPGLTKHFASYMRATARSLGAALDASLEDLKWAGFTRGHLVDVGGSTAGTAAFFAQGLPDIRFTVQDLPEVIEKVDLSTLPTDVSARITLAPHDFFQPQPTFADAYLLRRILHDWPFEEARTILNNLAVALQKQSGARIFIMDEVLSPPGEMLPFEEAKLRVRDLTLWQCFNGRLREFEDWKKLFASTTPKLSLKNIRFPARCGLAIMEVILESELLGEPHK